MWLTPPASANSTCLLGACALSSPPITGGPTSGLCCLPSGQHSLSLALAPNMAPKKDKQAKSVREPLGLPGAHDTL